MFPAPKERVPGMKSAPTLGVTLGAAGGSGGGGRVTVWTLQDTAFNPVQKKSVSAYNAASKDTRATMQTFVNDPYKQKLQTALGSPNAPDVFLNWGGGNLSTYRACWPTSTR